MTQMVFTESSALRTIATIPADVGRRDDFVPHRNMLNMYSKGSTLRRKRLARSDIFSVRWDAKMKQRTLHDDGWQVTAWVAHRWPDDTWVAALLSDWAEDPGYAWRWLACTFCFAHKRGG